MPVNIEINDNEVIIVDARGREKIYHRQFDKDSCKHANTVPYVFGPAFIDAIVNREPQVVRSKDRFRVEKIKCINCGAILDVDKDLPA